MRLEKDILEQFRDETSTCFMAYLLERYGEMDPVTFEGLFRQLHPEYGERMAPHRYTARKLNKWGMCTLSYRGRQLIAAPTEECDWKKLKNGVNWNDPSWEWVRRDGQIIRP